MQSTTPTTNPRFSGLSPTAARLTAAAGAALQQRRIPEAEQHLKGALALAPNHPEVLRLLAGLQGLHGQYAEAVATLKRAHRSRPNDPLIHNGLGTALQALKEFDAALAAFRCACELAPSSASMWCNLSTLLIMLGREDEALSALERALVVDPNSASAHVLRATTLKMQGQLEQAAMGYRQVIAQAPNTSWAWLGLAGLKSYRLQPADIEQLRLLLSNSTNKNDQCVFGFALAKALDDQGQYEEAFAILSEANAQVRRDAPWNGAAFQTQVDDVLQAFSSSPAGAGVAQGEEVIFIVSLPRAGSTLTEQILASHPDVAGANELSDLAMVIAEESERRQQAFPSWVRVMEPADWQRLGQNYLERTRYWRRQKPRFTDKMPMNWMYIGAALCMLPSARIVNCRRDPVETGLSCYWHYFTNSGQKFSYDLADIGVFWRAYDRAIRSWQKIYPGRVYEQVYEKLVDEPETQTRKLLEFCGLEFDPSCLKFYETKRTVNTVSASQVREPIRRDTARAARYGALLDPLRAALGGV